MHYEPAEQFPLERIVHSMALLSFNQEEIVSKVTSYQLGKCKEYNLHSEGISTKRRYD